MRPRQEIRTAKHNEELTNLVLAISQRAPKAHRKKANDMRKQLGKSIQSFCIPTRFRQTKKKEVNVEDKLQTFTCCSAADVLQI